MEASGYAYSDWSTSAGRSKVKLEQILQSLKACCWSKIIGLDYHNLFLKKSHAAQEYIMHLDKQVTKSQELSNEVSIRQSGFLRCTHMQPAHRLHTLSHPWSPIAQLICVLKWKLATKLVFKNHWCCKTPVSVPLSFSKQFSDYTRNPTSYQDIVLFLNVPNLPSEEDCKLLEP